MPPLPVYPDNVFFEMYVNNNPKGGSIVYWGMRRQFVDPLPYVFTLQWAESVSATNWVDVVTVQDTYWAVDPEPRQFAVETESFYRIKLTTPDGSYTSFPHQATGVWTKRDWLIARDICRKEQLVAIKFTGRKGWLLKRKVWGPKCPVCTDYDTAEVANSKCTICYGTGIIGGYWPGFEVNPYQLEGGPQQRHKAHDDKVGIRDDQVIQARILSYPHLATYDIFVEEGSGNRYVVRNVGTAAEMRSIPLVNIIELRLAAYTDIIYDVPIVPPVYVVSTPDKTFTQVVTDEFLGLPETPVVAPEPEEVPEEPVAPEEAPGEVNFDITPYYAIWCNEGQWHIGTVIGDTDSSLYRTTDGYSNPYFLPQFTWDPSGVTVTAINSSSFGVQTGVPSIDGTYIQAGTYENMFVYVKL